MIFTLNLFPIQPTVTLKLSNPDPKPRLNFLNLQLNPLPNLNLIFFPFLRNLRKSQFIKFIIFDPTLFIFFQQLININIQSINILSRIL